MAFFPDRSVVISLARRQDRRERFFASWQASGWGDVLAHEPALFEAVDGFAGMSRREIPVALRGQAGMYGCWSSHLAVLRQALDDGVERLAVFEDDAVLAPGSGVWFREVLANLPEHTDALWLDARLMDPRNRMLPGPFGAMQLLRPPLRTHAFIVSRALMQMWVPAIEAQPAHIDRLLAFAPVSASVFAAVPPLAGQASDGAVVGDSDTGSQAATLLPAPTFAPPGTGSLYGSKDALWLRRASPRV